MILWLREWKLRVALFHMPDMKAHTDLTLILGSGGYFMNLIFQHVYVKNNTVWKSNHKLIVN